MTQPTIVNDDQWFNKYKPVINPTGDGGYFIGDDCYMFETFGNDLEKIQNQAEIAPETVWTYMDSEESDDTLIVPGYHWVNAIGYFMTEIPCEIVDQNAEIICD